MPAQQPNEQLPLKLTAAERKLILDELLFIDQEFEAMIQGTPAGQPVMMSPDDLEDFGGYVAAEANHCDDPKKQKKLDGIFVKVQALLDKASGAQPPQATKLRTAKSQAEKTHDSLDEAPLSEQALHLRLFVTQGLAVATQLGIEKRALHDFFLAPAERIVLSATPGVPQEIKKKLAKEGTKFSLADIASMATAIADDFSQGDAYKQLAGAFLGGHLIDCMQRELMAATQPTPTKRAKQKSKGRAAVFQFKITLLGVKPPIWRRIQVQDGTLDDLHDHIQMAMGWTNSHLHQFEIQGQVYGDPELLDDGFGPLKFGDSKMTRLSAVLPRTSKRFVFRYIYDFGDSWEHEILFEGEIPFDAKARYPRCISGKRACPPEDCGGIWGYGDLLEILSNPDHEEHRERLRWMGGPFDPEAFDPSVTTTKMQEGLPDYSSLDDFE